MSEWLRADEAAVLLRVSVQTVWKIASRERWRRIRGRTVVYHYEDVYETAEQRALDKPGQACQV